MATPQETVDRFVETLKKGFESVGEGEWEVCLHKDLSVGVYVRQGALGAGDLREAVEGALKETGAGEILTVLGSGGGMGWNDMTLAVDEE